MGNSVVSLKVSRQQVCQENLQIQTLNKMSSISRQTLKLTAAALRPALQRNLATSYILAQAAAPAATDPVQGLFLEKIRAYATAKKLLVEHWLTLLLQPKLYCKLNWDV